MTGPRIPTDDAEAIEEADLDHEDSETVDPDIAGVARGDENEERIDIEQD